MLEQGLFEEEGDMTAKGRGLWWCWWRGTCIKYKSWIERLATNNCRGERAEREEEEARRRRRGGGKEEAKKRRRGGGGGGEETDAVGLWGILRMYVEWAF